MLRVVSLRQSRIPAAFLAVAGICGLFLFAQLSVGCTESVRCGDECQGCCQKQEKEQTNLSYLKKLRQRTEELTSYECVIEYLFSQPLLESKTLRKGHLYYQKFGKKTKLRINFETLQQDDYNPEEYQEQYIFDGVWLTILDYRIKTAKLIQQAEPNEPVNAFELARRNFPIIGFSSIKDLKKDFEIGPVEEQKTEEGNFVKFHLEVKPGSVYEEDYETVDFWVDKSLDLPAKIVTTTPEGDTYQIKLKETQVNKKIDKEIFQVRIPEGFGEPEVIPLDTKEQGKQSSKSR